jgi:IPT/TIG domain
MTAFRYRLLLLIACFQLFVVGTPIFAQSLQPSKTGLPGRTVWALTTTASGSGAARQTFTFAATDKGLWRSSDNGGVWTETTLKNQAVYAVKARTVGGTSTMLVGTDKGILRSVDGGATWQSPEVTTGTVISTSNILQLKKVFDIEIVNSTWYAATDKGVFRSTTDGRTWTLLNIDRTVDNNEVRGITAEGSTIIVNLWKEGLWRSTNNGGSWAKVNITGETALCRLVYAHQGTSGTVWLAGAVSGNLWRSTNSGTAWTRVTTGTTTARSSAQTGITLAGVDAMTSLGKTLFAGTATGIVISQNDGQTWRRYPAASTKAISMVSNGVDMLYVGYENEQKSSIAGKESGAEVQAAGVGTATFAIPIIHFITYSPNPVIPGQPVDIEIFGNNLTGFNASQSSIDMSAFTVDWGYLPNRNPFYSSISPGFGCGFPITSWIQGPTISNTSFRGRTIAIPCTVEGTVTPYFELAFSRGTAANGTSFDVIYSNYPNQLLGTFDAPFALQPTLTASSVSPPVSTGTPITVTFTGIRFIPGTTKLFYSFNGGTRTEITPITVNSSSSLTATLPAGALTAAGTLALTAENVAGTPSLPLNISVQNPVKPTLTSITPNRVEWYGTALTTTLTANGTNFTATSVIQVNGADVTTTRTGIPTALSTSLNITAPGRYLVRVKTPGSPDLFSDRIDTLNVIAAAPTLANISPRPPLVLNELPASLQLTGSAYLAGITASLAGTAMSVPAIPPSTQFLTVGLTQTVIDRLHTLGAGNHPLVLTNGQGAGESSYRELIPVVNPRPQAAGVQPFSVTRSTPAVPVQIRVLARASGGIPSFFATNATITFRGTTITPSARTATELTANIPTNLLDAAGTFPLTVTNPAFNGQGGGTSDIVYWIVSNPKPVASAVTPQTVIAGQSRSITVTGSSFIDGAVIRFRGTDIQGTVGGNGTTLTGSIPASSLDSSGVFSVAVINNNNGGTSDNKPLLGVLAESPTLNSLSQTTFTLGTNPGQALSLQIYGTGFVQNSRVMFRHPLVNGGVAQALTSLYVSASERTVTVPASLLTNAGQAFFSVVNDGVPAVLLGLPGAGLGGGTSLERSLTIQSQQPSFQTVSPASALRFLTQQGIQLTGQNFLAGARLLVSLNNVIVDTLTTNFTSTTTLAATLPQQWLNTAGVLSLRVLNPAPTVAPSSTVVFVVQNPRPRLTGLSSYTSLAGLPSLQLTATGSDFMENIQAYANGVSCTTTRTNAGSLTLTIPTQVLAQAGLVRIALQNPIPRQTPDFSDSLTVTVENPIARLDSLAPVPLTVSTQATAVTLYGTNFITLSVASEVSALPATVIPTTWLSQTQLSASIPASLTATTGLRTFTVVNPLTTVPSPARVNVNVVNPTPFAERITPSVITQNLDTSSANDRTVIITGDRFVTGVEVLVNNERVAITETTPTRLTVRIPAGRIVARGNYTVVVRNPVTNGTDGGAAAQTLTLTVNTPQAVVSGIMLSGNASGQVPLDTLNVPLVITGSQFLDSLIVRLVPPSGGAGVVLPLTSVSGSELRATIPFALLPVGGVYSLVVNNPTPTDAPSTPRTFAVVNPIPELDSITTLLGRALTGSAAAQTIRLFGRRFTPTSLVRWRDTVLTTTFVSRYELSAELSPQQQTRGNVGAVSVFTPTGGVVLNGNPVGGGTGFAPAPFGTLFVTHAVPTLSALSAPLGSPTIVRDAWNPAALAPLSMTGLVIASTSTVRIQAVDTLSAVNVVLTPTSRTPSSLTVSLPRSVLQTTGVFRVSITNPPAFAQALSAPDGGTSSELTLTVVNPTPSLGSLTPTALAVASVGTTPLALTGTNFTPESVLLVNGRVWTRSVVNASSITASLPDSLFTLSGFVSVRVVNPAPVQANTALTGQGDSSNVLTIEIFNPVPTLTTIAPVFTTISGSAPSDSVSVTLVGTNFVKNSLVRFVSTIAASVPVDLSTRYRSRDTLFARMLAADFRAGTFNLSVVNPAPRGGTSVARRFTITNPLPILSGLIPGTTTATGKAWTLTLVGQFFTPTSQVSYRNALQSLVNTTFIPGTNTPSATDTLRVKLAAVPVGDTTFPVVVVNPPTGGVGGGASDTMRLAVGLPVPVITTISPASAAVSLNVQGRGITLTVNGSGFDVGANIFVGGILVPTTVVSTARLTAVLPDSLQKTQAVRTVQVKNSPVLASNIVNATWYNPTPVLTTLSPSTITAGRDTTITLTGDRFAFNATVTLTSGATVSPLTVLTRDSVLGLTVRIPARLIGRRQPYYLRVTNPPLTVDTVNVGGGLSAVQTLTVDADKVFSVEYIGVDTLLNTGDRTPFFTLRFRDRVQNLVDNPTTLYFASSDNAVTGTFPLTQTSLGNYRADTLRFPTAGDYRLWIDTTSTGALLVIGKHTFTVLTRTVARAEITGLPTTITAGDTIPTFGQALTVRYFDTQNNLTDAGVRPVIVTGTSYRDTLVMTRTQTGVYEAAERVRYTTTGTFTLNLTGVAVANITGDRVFTVNPAPVRQVEYIGVDTLLNTGDRMPFITLRFRDRFQNLLDNSTTLYFASSDNAVTGTFPLTQTSLGNYRADTLRFPIAGDYRLWVDTASTGALQVIGKNYFTVETRGPVRVELANVQTILQAGDTAQAYTFRFYDVLNNLTDLNIRPVVVTGTSYRDTLALTRTNTGMYVSERIRYTTSGTFTITPLGIAGANITGDRIFTVLPRPAASVLFTSVTPALAAGSLQSRFRATLRDRWNNLTDSVQTDSVTVVVPTQAYFSMSTDATVDDSTRQAAAGFFPLTRTSLGVFTADTVRFQEAGKYSVGMAGVGSTSGTAAFIVRPNVDFRVVFENVPDTLVAGDSLKNITVRYFDRSDNPTDNGIGRVVYARTGGSSTATVAMSRVETGVYALESTQATIAGTYNLGVSGISSVNMEGNRRFILRPDVPISAIMTLSTTNMTSKGARVNITALFEDTYGNPTIAPTDAVLQNLNIITSTATYSFQKTGTLGRYVTTATVLQPGIYAVSVAVKTPSGMVQSTIQPTTAPGPTGVPPRFNINPGLALRATFVNFPLALALGDSLPTTPVSTRLAVRVTDTLGAATNIWDGTGRATGSLGGITKEVGFVQRDLVYDTHSGVFDLSPATVLAPAGTYTFRLFHKDYLEGPLGPIPFEIPFRSYSGNRTVDIVPKPFLATISPSVTLAGVSVWTLVADGTGFTANSRIVINNQTQATTRLVSPTRLAVEYLAATAGTFAVKVLSSMVKGVFSDPIPLTVIEPIKTAFVNVSGIPAQVYAGAAVPTVTIVVTDSATGLPLNLVNPFGRWFMKGVSDMPLVFMPTGTPGQYAAMCTRPNVTEAATYFLELEAENALIRFVSPQYPQLVVLGNTLTRVKVENFLPAPAPLYRDILPGHFQGDTLPAFVIRGYDRYDNLAEIPFGVTLYRAATANAPALTIPVQTRRIWRGVIETLPLVLDSAGEFELIQTNPSLTSVVKDKNATVTQSSIPFLDDAGRLIGKFIVMLVTRVLEPDLLVQPVLYCANPFIIPIRTPSSQKIDDNTPQNNRTLPGDYNLIWSDEFKGTTLDQTKWTMFRTATTQVPEAPGMPYYGSAGQPNTPFGYPYTENNVAVVSGADNNGYLRLSARKQDTPITGLLPDQFPYTVTRTSGAVHSRYKADFRYGKFVVRVRNVPNFPFMHHGVWVLNSENGGPPTEVDFPDAANSPFPHSGNNESAPEFNYTYLNNAHPRMAMSVIGPNQGVNTSYGEFSCAGPPDPNNQLNLGSESTTREYWMEWDRDAQGGYVKVGVNAGGQSQTLRWWGLKNEGNNGSAQFIPDAIRILPGFLRPVHLAKNTSATLGRFDDARQSKAPFSQFPTWLFDYFPMHVILDFDASSGWAGGPCLTSQYNTTNATICDPQIAENARRLSVEGGVSMDIDYVRVYQRDISAKNFKPIILDGTNFTRASFVRLYRTADLNAPYRVLETRRINKTTVVALLNDQDDVFLRQGAAGDVDGFVCVENRNNFGVIIGVSAFRRIILGGTENAIIRANAFSHRYQSPTVNTSTVSGAPPLLIKENNTLPNNTFTWTGQIDKLNMDLSNLPALGGATNTSTTIPASYSSLTRLQEARGRWELRLRSTAANGTTTWSPTRTFPQPPSAASTLPSPSWRAEQPSQHRGAPPESFRAVRVADDGDNNNIVNELGFYPSCSDLIEVTTFVATPAAGRTNVGDIYADQNLCGPFRIRTFLDPRPQVEIVGEPTFPIIALRPSANVNIRLRISPMMGILGGETYTWWREVYRRSNNVYTLVSPRQEITLTNTLAQTGDIRSGGTYSEANLDYSDSIRIYAEMNISALTAANTQLERTCTIISSIPVTLKLPEPPKNLANANPTNNSENSSVAKSSTTLSSFTGNQSVNTGSSETKESIITAKPVSSSHIIDLTTAPNPAETELGLRFYLPDNATVTLELIDAFNRPVLQLLAQQQLLSGMQEMNIPVGSLVSGVYAVRIVAHLENGKTLMNQKALLVTR